VILFEGGLNLEWRRLRREARVIRQLVTIGAIITAAGGALAAKLILGWDWKLSILFGSLVIVTGPTVITPLLRRIKVKRNLETILEAEGIFIDAIGAIIAVVTLAIVLGSDESLAPGVMRLPATLVLGTVLGAVGGIAMVLLLRIRGVVPEGFENVFTLVFALAIFQVSNTVVPESGIAAVIICGMVVGNSRVRVRDDLKEFKEQLTIMLIGMLFVLLAADVRIAEILSLGMAGVMVVVVLMLIVRPLEVFVCTLDSGLNWREKTFLGWLAPRGIVAAAVATLFYERMSAHGMAGGEELRAMVFLVIAVTVLFQGATGPQVARLLKLRRPRNQGYAILGANHLGIQMARLLDEAGEPVVIIDANPEACAVAERTGFRVVHGNVLDERVMIMAQVESRRGAVALLTNDSVNHLFVEKARGEYQVPNGWVALQRGHTGVTDEMVHRVGATVLFGGPADLELWDVRARRELTRVEAWTFGGEGSSDEVAPRDVSAFALPLCRRRGKTVTPFDDGPVKKGDEVLWLVFVERDEENEEKFRAAGWEANTVDVPDEPATS